MANADACEMLEMVLSLLSISKHTKELKTANINDDSQSTFIRSKECKLLENENKHVDIAIFETIFLSSCVSEFFGCCIVSLFLLVCNRE